LICGAPPGDGGIFGRSQFQEPVIPTQVVGIFAVIDTELGDGPDLVEEVEEFGLYGFLHRPNFSENRAMGCLIY
jgi:hypothetical protein